MTTDQTPLHAREAAALAELEDAIRFASVPRTCREIAARLGITHQAVSLRQKVALAKMRRALKKKGNDRS